MPGARRQERERRRVMAFGDYTDPFTAALYSQAEQNMERAAGGGPGGGLVGNVVQSARNYRQAQSDAAVLRSIDQEIQDKMNGPFARALMAESQQGGRGLDTGLFRGLALYQAQQQGAAERSMLDNVNQHIQDQMGQGASMEQAMLSAFKKHP